MIFVIVSFVLTSIVTLIAEGNLLTKEQALEISRNTPVVQAALNDPHTESNMMIIAVHYWSVTWIKSLKEKQPDVDWRFLPDDRGVWRVQWDITPPGYQILHFIGELTGTILYENWFMAG